MTDTDVATRETVASTARQGWHHLDTEQRRDRVRGALLGLACGDALGAPFEGRGTVSDSEVTLLAESPALLRCTDDTTMALVLAEHLADRLERGEDPEEDTLLRALARQWRNQPWRGYGHVLPQVFRQALAGVSWQLAVIVFGGGPQGAAAASRVAPVALCGLDLDRTLVWARRSARVTHTDPVDQAAAVLQAAAVYLAVTSHPTRPLDQHAFVAALQVCHGHPELTNPMRTVADLLAGTDTDTDPAHAPGHGSLATRAVSAAILAFLRSPDDPDTVVRSALRMGGATDTITAMAAALAGARRGANALPSAWRSRTDLASAATTAADRLIQSTAGHLGGEGSGIWKMSP